MGKQASRSTGSSRSTSASQPPGPRGPAPDTPGRLRALLAALTAAGVASGSALALQPSARSAGPARGAEAREETEEAHGPLGLIAILRMEVPDDDAFIARATLPVPPGFWRPGDPSPLSVLTHDRRIADTQVGLVSRYARAQDGADVIEVLARVERPPHLQPGQAMKLLVIDHAQARQNFVAKPAVRNLLAQPGALQLRTRDVFGNLYVADLWKDVREETGEERLLRDGACAQQHSTHEILLPVAPQGGPQGTLPHLMGVHAYLTQWADEDFFSLDLHIHNGMSGNDPVRSQDDALKEIYFDTLELRVPQGWTVRTAFPDPFLGDEYAGAGGVLLPLIVPMPGGSMHFMPKQGHLVRRLVVSRQQSLGEARQVLEERTLAFCTPGSNRDGAELFSWWNDDTARYYPQRQPLPRLDHVGLETIKNAQQSKLNEFANLVSRGLANGFPFLNPNLGYAHPYGVRYGGMTGGFEIYLYGGVETAAAASRPGYRLAQLLQRVYVDRHTTALYNLDGQPTAVKDWLVTPASGEPYVPFFFFQQPMLPDHDPFGFGSAPTFQTAAVLAQGRKPAYQDELDAYKPIDFQHHIRYTQNLKVMTWLGNDALSKTELRMAAELFRLSFHEYKNGSSGQEQGSGLRAGMSYVAQFPNWGIGFGRGTAWGTDTAVAAYAVGDDELRGRYFPWFQRIAQMVSAGQMACTGIIMAQPMGNKASGQYRVMQSFESSINENALWGMKATAFEGRSAAYTNLLEEVIADSVAACISPLVWRPQYQGPVSWLAVGPYDKTLPPFCDFPPPDGDPDGVDHFQLWSSFAYAYRITGQQKFLNKAAAAAGGGSLSAQLHSWKLENLGNQAALLALVQALDQGQ